MKNTRKNIMKSIKKIPAKRRKQAFAIITFVLALSSIIIIALSFFYLMALCIEVDIILNIGENSLWGLSSEMESDLSALRAEETQIFKSQIYFIPIYVSAIALTSLWFLLGGKSSEMLRAIVLK